MRQLRWGLKAEFPYTKVLVLGIFLTLLGCACVVVSVVGIVQLAWGSYVSTGLWGGVLVTASGLTAMYAARARTPLSARLYFSLAVLACLASFAMLVLSAGGLTYKSDFYQAVRLDPRRHQATLFLHGSVLGVGVVSLACNLLSVIVCCKFITKEKARVGRESFKLRRHRRHFSSADSNAVYRPGSVRGGGGGGSNTGTVRSSTSSRTPLFGSNRKHSRRTSGSDFNTNLKIPCDRTSNRRDSDRSRTSSRSHQRQSSTVSQHSRQSGGPMEAEVTTVLLRENQTNSLNRHRDRGEEMSSRSTAQNFFMALTDNASVQLIFDPDEEPLPPYEESRPSHASESRTTNHVSETRPSHTSETRPSHVSETRTSETRPSHASETRPSHASENRSENRSRHTSENRPGHASESRATNPVSAAAAADCDADESDTETVDGSSSIVMPSSLPLNIPVTHLGGGGSVECQALQRQPPPSSSGGGAAVRARPSPQRRPGGRGDTENNGSSPLLHRNASSSAANAVDVNNSLQRGSNRISLMRVSEQQRPQRGQGQGQQQGSPQRQAPSHHHHHRQTSSSSHHNHHHHQLPHPLEDRAGSPEICALMGGMSLQPADNVSGKPSSVLAAQTLQVRHSPDSSDTSCPGANVPAPQTPVTQQSSGRPYSGAAPHPALTTTTTTSSNSPSSALPAGVRSPSSAFRPVGRRIVPVAHGSPSHHHNHNNNNHHSVPQHNHFSPISSPASAHHVIFSPVASPSHAANHLASSSESLGRGGGGGGGGGSAGQVHSWKKMPLPASHNNHSNRTASMPTKEVTSKNIPGPAVPPSQGPQSQSLPRQSSREMEKGLSAFNCNGPDKARSRFAPVSSSSSSPKTNAITREPPSQFATFPVARAQEASLPYSVQQQQQSQSAMRHNSVDSVDSRGAALGGRSAFVGSRPGALGHHHPTAVSAHHQPQASVNNNNHSSSSSKAAPASSRFTAVSKHSPAAAAAAAAAASSKAASKGQPTSTNLDPGRRSAGCQATEEDGGISSSMDRTHRWVLGTLPSGTRFQGATKNTAAHIHSGAGSGSRSSAVSRQHSGRAHGMWDRPSKAAAPQPQPQVMSSKPVAPQPIRPLPGGMPSTSIPSSQQQPLVPQPIRPTPCVPGSSHHSQPVAPQPIRPKPSFASSHNSGFSPLVASSSQSQPTTPELVRPKPSVASPQVSHHQHTNSAPVGFSPLAVTTLTQSVLCEPGRQKPLTAFSKPSAQKPTNSGFFPLAVNSGQPVAAPSEPIRPKAVKASSSHAQVSHHSIKPSNVELSSMSAPVTSQPSGLRPVKPAAEVGVSSSVEFDPLGHNKGTSSFSRLPRPQPVPQPRARDQPPPPPPQPQQQQQQQPPQLLSQPPVSSSLSHPSPQPPASQNPPPPPPQPLPRKQHHQQQVEEKHSQHPREQLQQAQEKQLEQLQHHQQPRQQEKQQQQQQPVLQPRQQQQQHPAQAEEKARQHHPRQQLQQAQEKQLEQLEQQLVQQHISQPRAQRRQHQPEQLQQRAAPPPPPPQSNQRHHHPPPPPPQPQHNNHHQRHHPPREPPPPLPAQMQVEGEEEEDPGGKPLFSLLL